MVFYEVWLYWTRSPSLFDDPGMHAFHYERYPHMRAIWRAQLQRQQLVAREAGRIGYIGNAGPALGSTLPSGHGI